MPALCVCTQARAGGKPQFRSLALEKAIKALERGKPQSIIRSFATYLRCFWHALPWHLSPSLSPGCLGRGQPGSPGRARLSQQRTKAAPCPLPTPPSAATAGELRGLGLRLTLHGAGNFCHLLLSFLPCLTKISVTN